VVVAVYTVARVSGAHLNPAVTLAMAVKRGFPWAKVVPFWVAQLIGAFIGALGVYLVYRDGLLAAGLPNVFTTGPGSTFAQTYWGADATRQAIGSYSLLTATIAEILGMAVGASLGGASGYAINPARDLAPRVFAALIGSKDVFDAGLYWLVAPVIGPLVGGLVGVFTYDLFVTAYLPSEQPAPAATHAAQPAAATA
jgi:glycerol uptake facilitator protein